MKDLFHYFVVGIKELVNFSGPGYFPASRKCSISMVSVTEPFKNDVYI